MSFFSRRQPRPEPPQPEPPQPPPQPALPRQPVGFETVLGANSEMEGVLRSDANIRLDGAFSGRLEITGNVLVGETAKINADINARNISIAGAVRGNISGRKVQLLRTGRVWGDIQATALTTEEGAFIDGKIAMLTDEAPPETHISVTPEAAEYAPPDDMPFEVEAEEDFAPDDEKLSTSEHDAFVPPDDAFAMSDHEGRLDSPEDDGDGAAMVDNGETQDEERDNEHDTQEHIEFSDESEGAEPDAERQDD